MLRSRKKPPENNHLPGDNSFIMIVLYSNKCICGRHASAITPAYQ